jgi:uncharacterized membrane protein SpoIIM required for sporulation
MTSLETDENSRQALIHWLNSRINHWQGIDEKLTRNTGQINNDTQEAREVLSGFRSLMVDLNMARRHLPGDLITRYLESLLLTAHETIYRPPAHFLSRLQDLYCVQVPLLMRQLKISIFSTFTIFSLAILLGWVLVSAQPELVSLFASTEMINHVQAGNLWTDDLLNIAPSSLISLGIITNNITVSLFAFALGALYGLGTLYVISLNGLMLGGIFAFTRAYNLDLRLFEFIIAHGVVELSVIIISGAMGLQLGEALIRPGERNRLQAFQETTADAGKILFAAIPFLILAGVIEGFISPNPEFDLLTRVLVGISSGILFWSFMLFGLPGERE